jgi:perosamine synthetase
MLADFLPQMRPYFGDREREAIYRYNFEDGFLTEFKETEKFEKLLAENLKVPHTVAVNNGTIAISIAALAVGVEPGDEVIVPNFTMIATPNSIKLLGATPIFADVEKTSWCLDRQAALDKITDKTKAVILVSANGRYPSYDVDKFRQELNASKIMLIEDAAQGLGSFYSDGSAIGTKGNVATLSFSAPKIISTGQGGLVFSKCSEVLDHVRQLKDFGRASGGNDVHDFFGINSKFTDLQAIVGLQQMQRLEDRKYRRKQQNILYSTLLESIPEVEVPFHNYDFTTPWFSEILAEDRDNLSVFLKEKNIGTRVVYPEINKQKYYNELTTFENSQFISKTGLWLPSHMGVTDEIIKYICAQIALFYGK